jgi:3-oxoacyl-[acyl-carrier-protein] synthase II
MAERDALITGVGLISCLGEGPEAHWAALNAPGGFAPVVDAAGLAPYPTHPMAALELEKQIPRREQRAMEPWQRYGTYAAGLALDSAGLKGNADLLGRMDMIVAAGGGERDYAVDEAILSALPAAEQPEVLLNQRLMSDLRPTLFLAQLSNLLAGNISLVHGVIGSSRTFMGEEAAGADAVRIACARIAAGQGELFLVGGSFNAQRPDVLLLHELSGQMWQGDYAPVWARQPSGGGIVLGSLGCFLVIESHAHAAGRGAAPIARIAAVATDRCRRGPGEAAAVARRQFERLQPHLTPGASAAISGASGAPAVTAEEGGFLAELGLPVRAAATAFGHSVEPSFLGSLALASISVRHGRLFAPLEPAEAPMSGALRQALVTGWGAWRGEAMAVVEAVQ